VGVGAITLKPLEALDELYCAVPAKLALSVIVPVPLAVTWQDAFPLESVVPEQFVPPNVKLTCWPEISAAGVSDTSMRFAVRFTD
jgi:hypothetical protein